MLGLAYNDTSATQVFGQLTGDNRSVKHLRIGGVAGGMGSVMMPSVTNPAGIRMDELPLPIDKVSVIQGALEYDCLKKVMDDWMKAVFGGASLINSPDDETETKSMKLPRAKPGSATRTTQFEVISCDLNE